jgi:NAD(P)H-dependent FMN reductase
MRILAISGSLRAVSSNTSALQALASLAPNGVAANPALAEGLRNALRDLLHYIKSPGIKVP